MLVSIEKTDVRAIQSNLSQHFLAKVKAGPGVVMTIHHCHIALSCAAVGGGRVWKARSGHFNIHVS